jgi:ketosteroid isomerase-like protein
MADPFETFFADYADAFDRFDAEAIASFYHCPCMFVSAEGVAVLDAPDAIDANMRALLAAHRTQRIARAHVLALRTERLAPGLALVHVRWSVASREGTRLSEWSNTYQLVDRGEGWRIAISTTHDADVSGLTAPNGRPA